MLMLLSMRYLQAISGTLPVSSVREGHSSGGRKEVEHHFSPCLAASARSCCGFDPLVYCPSTILPPPYCASAASMPGAAASASWASSCGSFGALYCEADATGEVVLPLPAPSPCCSAVADWPGSGAAVGPVVGNRRAAVAW